MILYIIFSVIILFDTIKEPNNIPIIDPKTTNNEGKYGICPFLLYMITPGKLCGRSCITSETPTADCGLSPEYISNGIDIIPAPIPMVPIEIPATNPIIVYIEYCINDSI